MPYFALDFLALADEGHSVCVVGPPGTGKTESFKVHFEQKGQAYTLVTCGEDSTLDSILKHLEGNKEAVPIVETDKLSQGELLRLFAYAGEQVCHIAMNRPAGFAVESLPEAKGKLKVFPLPEFAAKMGGFCGCQNMLEKEFGVEGSSAAWWLFSTSHGAAELLPKKPWFDFGLRNMKRVVARAKLLHKRDEHKSVREAVIVAFCELTWLRLPCERSVKPFLLMMAEDAKAAVEKRLGGETDGHVSVAFEAGEGGVMILGDVLAEHKLALLKDKKGTIVEPLGGKDLNTANFDEKVIADAIKDAKDTALVFRAPGGDAVFERFNSLLDGNRKFALSSGETVPLDSSSTVVLLMNNVDKLKPAMISRNCVVCVGKS